MKEHPRYMDEFNKGMITGLLLADKPKQEIAEMTGYTRKVIYDFEKNMNKPIEKRNGGRKKKYGSETA